ncbi:hypothetical protein ACFLS9_02760 [Bacteroidota bacterium]
MKNTVLSFLSLLLLILIVLPIGVYPQENNSSELSIPWDEFKKLINLDEDEIIISLETFQKLLAQTGVTTSPQHTLKNGNVVMKRNDFKNLINRMKPPKPDGIIPPFNYLITKAIYSGSMSNSNTDFTASFTVHVLKKDTYLKIPVLQQSIAISDIKVNNRPALVVSENGFHNIIVSEAGEFLVTASFSVKSSLDKGPHKIDLAIQQTPITLLRLEIPKKEIDFEIPEAQQVQTRVSGNKIILSAVIAQKSTISIRWRKKVAAAEKLPAKLYSEVYHLVSINDDALKIHSDINYNILHSEVDVVRISIPENMNVLSVTGEGVGEWQEVTEEDEQLVLIPFTYGKKGKVTVRVTAETPLTENGLVNQFTGFKTLETVRETGFIGVALNTSAEVLVTKSDGLEKMSITKLPVQLINKSAKPLIVGYKYLKHPFNMMLDIKKHEKIGVPVATINSASVVTLFTEDGKIVHRLVYQVRNSSKQFLEITLPDNADVWSVFVGGQPVESSLNSEGKLLVPLIRSRSLNNRLDTFPVEVIYNMVDEPFAIFGSQESSLPVVDLMVSQLIWSVYLPNDYSYKYFSSTLEKEEIIRGINIFSEVGREFDESMMDNIDIGQLGDKDDIEELKKVYKGKDYKSSFRNNRLKDEQMQSQVNAELEFSQRLEDIVQEAPSVSGITTGVLPIQIEVPTNGQVYRFAKSIIKPEDELSFSVTYIQLWVNDLIIWIIIIIFVLLIYLSRRRFGKPWNWLKEKTNQVIDLIKKNESVIRSYTNSYITPIVLFVLMLIFSSISFFITVILLGLFLTSVINLIMNYIKKKKQEKAET